MSEPNLVLWKSGLHGEQNSEKMAIPLPKKETWGRKIVSTTTAGTAEGFLIVTPRPWQIVAILDHHRCTSNKGC